MGPCKKKPPDHGFVPAQVCTLVPTVTGVVPMRDVLQIRPMCRRYRLLVEPEIQPWWLKKDAFMLMNLLKRRALTSSMTIHGFTFFCRYPLTNYHGLNYHSVF